jgi:hypothetical protein
MFKQFWNAVKAEWLVYKTSSLFVRWGVPVAAAAVLGGSLNAYRNFTEGHAVNLLAMAIIATSVMTVSYRLWGWIAEGSVVDRYTAQPIDPRVVKETIDAMEKAALPQNWRCDRFQSGEGLTSARVNLQILNRTLNPSLEILPDPWLAWKLYHDDLRKFTIHRAVRQNGGFSNDGKVRLANDFIDDPAALATVQPTDYLSSLMTDQYRWSLVRSKKAAVGGMTPESVLWDGRAAIWQDGPSGASSRIRTLADSPISNQIGASTFAFSRDGYLMLVLQKDNNHQSANSLAPSGSGSLDWADIERSKAQTLIDLARFGAERELREECALDDDLGTRNSIRSRTQIFAFTRMVHRLGKPEFYALARIDAAAQAIRARKPERYVEQVVLAGVDPITLNGPARPSVEVARACQQYLGARYTDAQGRQMPMSYPLEHGLHLLIEACASDGHKSEIDAFMLKSFDPAALNLLE